MNTKMLKALTVAFALAAATGCAAGSAQFAAPQPVGDLDVNGQTVSVSRTTFRVSDLFVTECVSAAKGFNKTDKMSAPELAGEVNGRKVYVSYFQGNFRKPVFMVECAAGGQNTPTLTNIRDEVNKGDDTTDTTATATAQPPAFRK